MSQPPANRLFLSVVPLNLSVNVYLLWAKEPLVVFKILATLILVGSAVASLYPRFAHSLSGPVYVAMLFLGFGVCLAEYTLAAFVSGRFYPGFAFDLPKLLSFSAIFLVLIGIPVMWLRRMGREFVLPSNHQPGESLIRPIREGEAKFAGGRSGCSIQIVLLLAFGLFALLADWIAGREAMDGTKESILFGIAGPGFLLLGGPLRWMVDNGFPPLFLVGVAVVILLIGLIFVLAFLASVHFAWLSRLAVKLVAWFGRPVPAE